MKNKRKYKDPNQVRTIMAEPMEEEIIKEFDKKFELDDYTPSTIPSRYKSLGTEIKFFILKALSSQKKDILEKIEKI